MDQPVSKQKSQLTLKYESQWQRCIPVKSSKASIRSLSSQDSNPFEAMQAQLLEGQMVKGCSSD